MIILESAFLVISANQLSIASKLYLFVQSNTMKAPTDFLKKRGAKDLNFSCPRVSQI